MNATSIEWVKNPDGTQGYTWNPITGCLNGCLYCYARRLANGRLRQRYLGGNSIPAPYEFNSQVILDPFYPRFWEERLVDLVVHPKKRMGIFVCDMGELFGDWIPREWQDRIFSVIRAHPQHRFYLLTKQPQNLIKWSPFPDNCWVGVTATDAKSFLAAGRGLEQIEAKIKYISLEPFLDYIGGLWAEIWFRLKINWLIIGAQTKPYKPPKIEWVEEIVRAADKAGIPVFLKNNLKPLYIANTKAQGQICTDYVLRQELPHG